MMRNGPASGSGPPHVPPLSPHDSFIVYRAPTKRQIGLVLLSYETLRDAPTAPFLQADAGGSVVVVDGAAHEAGVHLCGLAVPIDPFTPVLGEGRWPAGRVDDGEFPARVAMRSTTAVVIAVTAI